jgi:LTXXQ motif family protein
MHRTNTRPIGLPMLFSALMAITSTFARAADSPADAASVTAVVDEPQVVADSNDPKQHDPTAYVQKRLDKLKAKLQITSEQETQWRAFSAAVMQQMEQFKAGRDAMKNNTAKALERIDAQIAAMKQRLAAFETIGQSAKELYSVLNLAQQQIADQRLLRWHHKHVG